MMTHLINRIRRKAARITVLLIAAVGLSAAVGYVQPAVAAISSAGSAAGEDGDDAPAAVAAGKPKEGDVRGHRRILIVDYSVRSDCKVHANYPVNPGDHGWTIPKGAKISWRFNVTSKVAAISDPAATSAFPHWGFVEDSGCIGTSTGQRSSYQQFHNGKWVTHETSFPAGRPVPSRILSGRSQYAPYWRAVDWHPDHGAVPAAHRQLGHNRTLRDAPHRFVIGNVYADWQVRPTGEVRDGYTKVYVPSLHRWGWLQL
jgi:hypothetical protein